QQKNKKQIQDNEEQLQDNEKKKANYKQDINSQCELQDITSISISSILNDESGYQGNKSSFNIFLKEVQSQHI
ncbi:1098_t:CDS:2, partial [Dentiscutata erythropus]